MPETTAPTTNNEGREPSPPSRNPPQDPSPDDTETTPLVTQQPPRNDAMELDDCSQQIRFQELPLEQVEKMCPTLLPLAAFCCCMPSSTGLFDALKTACCCGMNSTVDGSTENPSLPDAAASSAGGVSIPESDAHTTGQSTQGTTE